MGITITLDKIYTVRDVYRIRSKSTVLALERAGKFPRRFYLGPKTPVWDKEAVDKWVAEHVRQSEVEGARASQFGARLIQAKQLKAAA